MELLNDDLDKVAKEARARRLSTIETRFLAFHGKNPRVYSLLVRFARELRSRGHARGGIGHIWERMRWELMVSTQAPDEFKLNDNFRSRYSRLIMASEPDLRDFFRTRKLRAP